MAKTQWNGASISRDKLNWLRTKIEYSLMSAIFASRYPKSNAVVAKANEVFATPDDMPFDPYVADLQKIVDSTVFLRQTIVNIFVDMWKYRFDAKSSVNAKYDVAHLNDPRMSVGRNAVRYLVSVSLYDHTVRVAMGAVQKWRDSDSIGKALNIVIALLHDFGKCSEIFGEYRVGNASMHSIVSADYARVLFEQMRFRERPFDPTLTEEAEQIVVSTLRMHHDKIAKETLFLGCLCDFDRAARSYEYDHLRRKGAR
jgi:hypothetical protein